MNIRKELLWNNIYILTIINVLFRGNKQIIKYLQKLTKKNIVSILIKEKSLCITLALFLLAHEQMI